MSEYTKDEALAFIEAIRLTLGDRVGFHWLADKLSGLAAYVAATAAENEALNAYVDQAGTRADYESFLARKAGRTSPDAGSGK